MRGWTRTLLALQDAWRHRRRHASKGYTRQEAEFLAPLMEIEEAPPAPAARLLLWSLVLMLCAALVWSYYGRLDIVVEANGKIRPEDEVKAVQVAVAGQVARIAVREGAEVHQGDILVELEQIEVDAEHERLVDLLTAARLEEALARLLLQVVDATSDELVASLVSLPDLQDMPENLLEEKQSQIVSRRGELLAQLRELDAQWESLEALKDTQRSQVKYSLRLLERQEEHDRIEMHTLAASIAKQDERVALLVVEHDRLLAIFAKEIIRKSQLERGSLELIEVEGQRSAAVSQLASRRGASERERLGLEAEIANQRSKIAELETQQTQVIRQQELIRETFRHEMTDMRLQSKEQMRELEQQLVKVRELRSNHMITAPVSGVVEQLAIHAVGAVVEPTQTLMVVVPADARLHVEVFVENKDVGHLIIGQEVALKLDAFPHFKHGLLRGELLDVADDALEVPDMGLVYPARIGLSRHVVQVGDRSVPLAPGMSVTAEIRTGERPLYEFFLEPLLHHREQALDER